MEIIHVVSVAPILAPIMTGKELAREMRAALTKLMIITVVAVEDWTRAASITPVHKPVKGLCDMAA